MYPTKIIGIIMLSLMLFACATTPQLSQDEVNKQYPALVKFKEILDNAQENQVDLLAPEGFKEAQQQYENAIIAASNNDEGTATTATDAGLDAIQKALKDANNSKSIFNEVLAARQKATKAGADKLFEDKLDELDKNLSEANHLVEQGQLEEAKRRRPQLQRAYSDLELLALKQGTTRLAEAALNQARENNADKLAPKTYAQAKEEMHLAESILEMNRSDTEKANAHATRSTVLSNRSINIAELVKDFDRRNFSKEDIVLWHQSAIATVTSPLGKELSFDEPNDSTINTLYQEVNDLVTANNENQQKVNELQNKLAQTDALHQQQVAELNQKHAEELATMDNRFQSEIPRQEISRAEMAAMEIARESKFDRIQDMFKTSEANVYRQKNNILLSIHGIDFPPGNADIKPNNFALMDKIVKSIAEFKNAKVVVSGHTDITGSAEINKNLSEQRAQNVAKFLNEVGGIAKEQIVAEGYGQTKPVASNDTPEGRALNRRVEILIVNK